MIDFNGGNMEEELINSILFNLKQNSDLIDRIVGNTLDINTTNNDLSQILDNARLRS